MKPAGPEPSRRPAKWRGSGAAPGRRPFEILEHTADIGIRAYGKTLKETFENAARGMFSLITDLELVELKKETDIEVKALDKEGLLLEWLGELLYHLEVDDLLFKDFEIKEIEDDVRLKGIARGERINPEKHPLKIQIKAVTYHMLEVKKNDLWQAQVIFDI